ncbi:MAG: dual specificity protein phosphatase family protein [Nitrososphaeria archaeon]
MSFTGCSQQRPGRLRGLQLRLSDLWRILLSLVLGRPSNFSRVEGDLFASGIPYGRRASEWLRRKGIRTVVNLTERKLGHEGIEEIWIPMKNGHPQPPERIHEAVLAVSESLKRGRTLVHCSAGLGRTGMVLSCYLIYSAGLSSDEALKRIRSLRRGSVSDRVQEECVRAYEAWLRQGARDEQLK